MTLTRLKTKNQLTIPSQIVKRLHLRINELFAVDVEKNYIKLMPIEIKPRYTSAELRAIDTLIAKEKSKGRALKPGRQFLNYVKKITHEENQSR